MTTDGVDGDIVKWYTRARKFPQLLGRFADGNKIPGGPYTITQAFGAGGVLLLARQTTGIWARYGLLGNAALLAAVVYGLVLALGRIPPGARNPMSIAAGIGHAVCAPRQGRIAGRRVRLRRPHRVQHYVVIHHPAVLTTVSASSAAVTATPPPAQSTPLAALRAFGSRPPAEPHLAVRRTALTPRRPQPARGADQPVLSGVQLLLAALPVEQPESKDL